MSSRYKITVVTDNVNEPESFAAVQYDFFDGFFRVQGVWDTHIIRCSLIREIRIVEFDDWEQRLEVKPKEWAADVAAAKKRERDKRMLDIRSAAVAAINHGRDEFIVGDAEWLDEEVEKASKSLNDEGFALTHREGGRIGISELKVTRHPHGTDTRDNRA